MKRADGVQQMLDVFFLGGFELDREVIDCHPYHAALQHDRLIGVEQEGQAQGNAFGWPPVVQQSHAGTACRDIQGHGHCAVPVSIGRDHDRTENFLAGIPAHFREQVHSAILSAAGTGWRDAMAAGSRFPTNGSEPASNLTPHACGRARWPETGFLHTTRTGQRPAGRLLDPLMPWQCSKHR